MADPTGRISHLPDMHRGVAWKEPCRVATTANITISTALNAGDTIDGVTLAAGDRVLVKDQSTGSQNGIYVAGVTPTRAFDMDQDSATSVPASEVMGAIVYVIAGTANAGTLWRNTNTTAPTLGSTSLTFSQITTSGLSDPMTTRGDIIIRNASNVTARLGRGAAGTILTSDGTDVAWGNGPMTTQDDLIVGGASGVPTRLAKGSDSQVLTVDPTTHHLVWATPSTGFTNPMTTKGDLIVGDTGGSPIRKAVGTDGQFLKADSASTGGMKWDTASGSGTVTTVEEVDGSPTDSAVTKIVFPNGTLSITSHVATYTPSGGASGALVFLEAHTASTSATLDFTSFISSTYDTYLFELIRLVPATNSQSLLMRFSTDGGSTFTSSGYQWASHFVYGAGSSGTSGSTSDSGIALSPNSISSSGVGVSGTATLYDPAAASSLKAVINQTTRDHTSVGMVHDVGSGTLSVGAINAVRFLFATGNITSGIVRVYGVTKS